MESIHTVPFPLHDDIADRKRQRAERKEKRKERLKKICCRLLKILSVYLDDLLLVAGCACFTSGAAIKWGTAEALGVCGVCLTAYAIIVARGGIGRR